MERYKAYPELFKIFGTVRDVSDPAQEHYKSLLNNRKELLGAADALLSHLYGRSGMLMEMETRNAILDVWLACHLFQTNEVTIEQLIGYFCLARRWLRADLQIEDVNDVKSKFSEEIGLKFNMEASDKKLGEDERSRKLKQLTAAIR